MPPTLWDFVYYANMFQCSYQHHNPPVIQTDDLTAHKHENTMQKEPKLMQCPKILPACAVKSISPPPDRASEDGNTREQEVFPHSCLDEGKTKSLPVCLFCLQTTINLCYHTTTTLYWMLSNQTLLGNPTLHAKESPLYCITPSNKNNNKSSHR